MKAGRTERSKRLHPDNDMLLHPCNDLLLHNMSEQQLDAQYSLIQCLPRRFFCHGIRIDNTHPCYTGNSSNPAGGAVPCASPVEWVNLLDGRYSFVVTAQDRLGNTAQPEETAFLVDTTPPAIDNIACPVATQDSNFTTSFSASDAASGVNSTDCW